MGKRAQQQTARPTLSPLLTMYRARSSGDFSTAYAAFARALRSAECDRSGCDARANLSGWAAACRRRWAVSRVRASRSKVRGTPRMEKWSACGQGGWMRRHRPQKMTGGGEVGAPPQDQQGGGGGEGGGDEEGGADAVDAQARPGRDGGLHAVQAAEEVDGRTAGRVVGPGPAAERRRARWKAARRRIRGRARDDAHTGGLPPGSGLCGAAASLRARRGTRSEAENGRLRPLHRRASLHSSFPRPRAAHTPRPHTGREREARAKHLISTHAHSRAHREKDTLLHALFSSHRD